MKFDSRQATILTRACWFGDIELPIPTRHVCSQQVRNGDVRTICVITTVLAAPSMIGMVGTIAITTESFDKKQSVINEPSMVYVGCLRRHDRNSVMQYLYRFERLEKRG